MTNEQNNKVTSTETYLLAIIAALAGLLVFTICSTPIQAQEARTSIFEPAALDGAKTWCWERDPYCSPVAHASISVGFAAVLDVTGIMDGDDARWIPLGFYAAKEVYDYHRAGDVIAWYDYPLDFGGAVVGWWVSGLLFGGD